MTPWHPNPGHPPLFDDSAGDPCPSDRIPASQAASARVFVRLANGHEPATSWAVLGRPRTRWSITGDGHDIAEWRPA